ncbi:hypothetical protein [Embleya sp. NBC_00896]|uniref:hypothetical protein n=1 Tax=Embleya sp. NBC_00896 TaxID=2975961 RepID=UPI003869200E|nr:hypothetical protein OG928_32880 [Embleya sp. NBC_00896]
MSGNLGGQALFCAGDDALGGVDFDLDLADRGPRSLEQTRPGRIGSTQPIA